MLLSNEEEIVSSNGGKVILTNQRICMNDTDWGQSYSITIFLEDISSVEMRYTSKVVFIILGVVAALLCSYMYFNDNEGNPAGGCLIATIIFFLLYWFTRKQIVSITSNGGKALNFEAASLPEYEVLNFLAKVQEAKLQRVGALAGLSRVLRTGSYEKNGQMVKRQG